METTSRVIVVLALLAQASIAMAATPPYSCYGFGSSNAKKGHDKSGTRQLDDSEESVCTDSCGAIEPTGDIIREVGQPYEATCLFDPKHINVADVFFEHRGNINGNIDAEPYRINHTVLNSSAIQVHVTPAIAETYLLFCKNGSQHLCSRTVKVGNVPQDVQNFSCVSRYWSDLNCTWTVPYNPVEVKYYLTYVIPGFKKKSKCPSGHLTHSSCYWAEEQFTTNVKDNFIITFNATNILKPEGVTYQYNISTFASLLPPPVIMETPIIGSSEVTLIWSLDHPMDTFKKFRCEVAYKEVEDGAMAKNIPWKVLDHWFIHPDRWTRTEKFNKTITDLHAYVNYTFRVRIHTGYGPVRSYMWSEPALFQLKTLPTYPTVAPKTTNGTFEAEETHSYRDIYVIWQKVDSLYHNGANFHYQMNAYDTLNKRIVEEAEPDIKKTYAKYTNMQRHVPYRFEIIPVNGEGGPIDDSVRAYVDVPASEDLLKSPTHFKVIADDRTLNKTIYSVRWRVGVQDAHLVKTVTLFWCKKDKYEERCLNKLEWEVVTDPNQGMMNLTNLEEDSLYLFGISLNSDTSSSGIKWISCIARSGNQPPPLEQFGYANVHPREVLLSWSLDCKAKAAEPIGFNISYCTAAMDSLDCLSSSEKRYIHIDDEAINEHTVKDLHPYTNYIFNIAILTQIGPSKWSRSLRFRTTPDKPSGPPLDLEIQRSGQSWALLSWRLPSESDRNGRIVAYRISWDSPTKTEKHIKAGNSSEYTLYNVTNLEPFTNYKYQVLACSEIWQGEDRCGNNPAKLEGKTKIGVPSKVDDISQVELDVKWNHECTNGPNCFYELKYVVNGTDQFYETGSNAASINIDRDLKVKCSKEKRKIVISVRAVTIDEANQKLYGPWREESVACYLSGVPWWLIVVIVAVASVIVIFVLVIGRYGWDKIKEFLHDLQRKPVLPPGLEIDPGPFQKNPYRDAIWPQLSHEGGVNYEKQKSPNSALSEPTDEPECQDLIPPGGERCGRNLSGDSGTSETDPGDSSGCSTGGESDSSSASDRVHQSSDSGTVQEEPGFHTDSKWRSGSLRQRTSGTPYVRNGLPEGMSAERYVSAGSVPNLAVGMSDGSLQHFPPNGALGTLPEAPLANRTSTGYLSMPDTDGDNISLDILNNLPLSHDGRQAGFPMYSRHNFPYKKASPDMSPYTKTGSLPWLNTGYVAVAQAEGGRREVTPQARGYVAVSDALDVMKRQPSLPSLNSVLNKTVSTPDEDLPPGAYCRVGSRSSPGPPSQSTGGYVGLSQALPLHTTPNSLIATSPTNKSPYVTCAVAEALVSPTSTPEKVSGGYVSVGDLAGNRWAHPVMQPDTNEESREVSSAPVESSRARPHVPPRPSTSDATVNHNRAGSRWPPLAPSLSKQSSGYVSQETLTFHDPVVMSPKRLLAQSHEPHSVVLSASHKASMV